MNFGTVQQMKDKKLLVAAQMSFTRYLHEVTRIDRMGSEDIKRHLVEFNIVQEIEDNRTR
jgi:hypothetical protein